MYIEISHDHNNKNIISCFDRKITLKMKYIKNIIKTIVKRTIDTNHARSFYDLAKEV